MLNFPNIAEPNIPGASNCGSSFTEDLKDSTISTTTDANYTITRARTTRVIGSWVFSWVGMSESDYALLRAFYKQVGKSEKFSWINPIDGQTYTVRITEKGKWQWYPYGWQGSMTFEEV